MGVLIAKDEEITAGLRIGNYAACIRARLSIFLRGLAPQYKRALTSSMTPKLIAYIKSYTIFRRLAQFRTICKPFSRVSLSRCTVKRLHSYDLHVPE